MEVLIPPLLALPLVIIVGAILGIVAFNKVGKLEQRVQLLEQQLNAHSSASTQSSATTQPSAATQQEKTQTEAHTEEDKWLGEPVHPALSSSSPVDLKPTLIGQFISHLYAHWMVLLGGVSVGLAGIFMVRYSIEQQLLGPEARLLLSALSGLGLHALAHWLRVKKGENIVFAALAGGASIILYATLLGAFNLLEQPPVAWIFVAMALVSGATMLLALKHGPMLAALGMLGGYLVPILLSSGSGQIEIALGYVLILSLFSLWLMAYVQRAWLWQAVAVAGFIWWLISLNSHPSTDIRSFYLVVFAYLLVALPRFDWRLQQSGITGGSWWPTFRAFIRFNNYWQEYLALAVIVLAQGVSWAIEGFSQISYIGLFALPLLLSFLAQRRAELNPLLSLLLVLAAISPFFEVQNSANELATSSRLAALGVLFVAMAAMAWRRLTHYQNFWLGLGVASPLLMLASAYYVLESVGQHWPWGIAAVTLGLAYCAWAVQWQRSKRPLSQVILLSAAHVAWALAVVILLSDATLTLALSAQLLSLAWLQQRFKLQGLNLALRLVLLVVVVRLSLNPWLFSYGNHNPWLLWTYAGAFGFAAYAAFLLRSQLNALAWLIGGSAQLLVLLLAVVVRWTLYDGEVYQTHFSTLEASIYVAAWGSLALLYQWRVQVSQQAVRLYGIIAQLHLWPAVALYLSYILLIQNPLLSAKEIGSTPIFNSLLLSFGAPLVLLALWFKQVQRGYWPSQYKQPVGIALALQLLFFVSLEVRHLWHLDDGMQLTNATEMGELYSYSVAWLLLAVAAIVASIWRHQPILYKGGVALLLVVVAKIFLIDMSNLSGLWRVASFMGLGLTLLAIAWLYQRFGRDD